jgi:predicted O-methyltransferase YrrM
MGSMKAKLVPLIRTAAELGQRAGVNISPAHFYSDIPNFRQLRAEQDWRKPYSMHAVRGADTAAQLRFIDEITAPVRERLRASPPGNPANIHEEASRQNGEGGYGPTEAEVLYSFAASKKPAHIVQVGCGVSTAILLQAAKDTPGYSPKITCIEPYPTPVLTQASKDGKIAFRIEKAQSTPMDVFTALGPGDFLFVDSTHTLRPGSEVPRLILEVLPRLRPGVMVHFHDIYFPFDYPPQILDDALFFWHETLLLYGLLAMNPGYEILASLSMLHNKERDGLKRCLPNYQPAPMSDGVAQGQGHFPTSIFIRRTEG